jgi:large subunit ribosomal protein L25
METFSINATPRTDTGKGASRRLRRTGQLPGIIYGADSQPSMISLSHNELLRHLENEAFYSHVLSLNLDGKTEQVVLKALQRHPSKPFVEHADFMRVEQDKSFCMTIPVHFDNEASCPGVKRGATATKYMTSVEVKCKPGDLPENITIDLGNMDVGQSVHLADITPPPGVSFPALAKGPKHNYAVVAILGGRNVK